MINQYEYSEFFGIGENVEDEYIQDPETNKITRDRIIEGFIN